MMVGLSALSAPIIVRSVFPAVRRGDVIAGVTVFRSVAGFGCLDCARPHVRERGRISDSTIEKTSTLPAAIVSIFGFDV
jgi:hypothetical protein